MTNFRELAGGTRAAAARPRPAPCVRSPTPPGVSLAYLSEVERGRKEPSSEVLEAVTPPSGCCCRTCCSRGPYTLVRLEAAAAPPCPSASPPPRPPRRLRRPPRPALARRRSGHRRRRARAGPGRRGRPPGVRRRPPQRLKHTPWTFPLSGMWGTMAPTPSGPGDNIGRGARPMRYVEVSGLRCQSSGWGLAVRRPREVGAPTWARSRPRPSWQGRDLGITLIDTAEGTAAASPNARSARPLPRLAHARRPCSLQGLRHLAERGAGRRRRPRQPEAARHRPHRPDPWCTSRTRWSAQVDHGRDAPAPARGSSTRSGVSNHPPARWVGVEGRPQRPRAVQPGPLQPAHAAGEVAAPPGDRRQPVMSAEPARPGCARALHGSQRARRRQGGQPAVQRGEPAPGRPGHPGPAGAGGGPPGHTGADRLAWVVHHPNMVAIPGARNVAQLEANAAADITLALDELAHLNNVRPVPARLGRQRGRGRPQAHQGPGRRGPFRARLRAEPWSQAEVAAGASAPAGRGPGHPAPADLADLDREAETARQVLGGEGDRHGCGHDRAACSQQQGVGDRGRKLLEVVVTVTVVSSASRPPARSWRPQRLLAGRSSPAGQLVQQQQLRLGHQRPGHLDALLPLDRAAPERAAGQVDAADQVEQPPARRRLGRAVAVPARLHRPGRPRQHDVAAASHAGRVRAVAASTTPILARIARRSVRPTSSPSSSTSAAQVARAAPARRSSVLLPAPFGPSTAVLARLDLPVHPVQDQDPAVAVTHGPDADPGHAQSPRPAGLAAGIRPRPSGGRRAGGRCCRRRPGRRPGRCTAEVGGAATAAAPAGSATRRSSRQR